MGRPWLECGHAHDHYCRSTSSLAQRHPSGHGEQPDSGFDDHSQAVTIPHGKMEALQRLEKDSGVRSGGPHQVEVRQIDRTRLRNPSPRKGWEVVTPPSKSMARSPPKSTRKRRATKRCNRNWRNSAFGRARQAGSLSRRAGGGGGHWPLSFGLPESGGPGRPESRLAVLEN